MSVLIKGMELPESCSGCAIRYEMFCPLRHRFIADEGRRKNCPLVPVPPHGRLIDADALISSIKMQTEFCKLMGGDLATAGGIIEKGFLQEIDNAPTIIPAEPGEEETT